jgi:hypothetical protein
MMKLFLCIFALSMLGCSEDGDSSTDAAAGHDAAAPQCQAEQWACSEDGTVLSVCADGQWQDVQCMTDQGKLCEEGQCVAPWRYGSPKWSDCPNEPEATTETLAAKAAAYDEIATRLHIHPQLKWIMSVVLDQVETDCPAGKSPPCYTSTVPESTATYNDVVQWRTGENDGLWNGLYMASLAYRYAVTQSKEALDTLRVILQGEVARMEITGVPGLFTRQFIPPNVPGISCPDEDDKYMVDEEKDDNRWVKIKDDGCVWVVDRTTQQWRATSHCGLDAYAGWCWLDNLSQDEYAGHMFGLGTVWELVDDPDIKKTAADLLEQVGLHLMQNSLTFVDWDGRATEHGKLYSTALVGAPGFLAVLAMDYVLMATVASGRQDLRDFYDNCLLQRGGEKTCLPWPLEKPVPYTDFTDMMLLFVPPEGCKSNFNNHSMLMSGLFSLIGFERDIATREALQNAFDTEVMRADDPKAGLKQLNSWYNFMWAAHKRLGPGSDGPAYEAVEQAICMLKQFPASQSTPDLDATVLYDHYCEGRLGDSMTKDPIPVVHRCPRTFLWWSNPFIRRTCTGQDWVIRMPADYLLAYWMGRYYGFIDEQL